MAQGSSRWPGARAVTNKGRNATPKTSQASSSTGKKPMPLEKQPSPGPSSGQKPRSERSAGGKKAVRVGQAPNEDEEDVPPPNTKGKGKRRWVMVDDDDDDDNDDNDNNTIDNDDIYTSKTDIQDHADPSSDTLHSDDAEPPQKKVRRTAPQITLLQPPQPIPLNAPFLIRKANVLNINDKDAVRKAYGVYDFYDKCLNAYRMCGPFINLEAAYVRAAELSADYRYIPCFGGSTLDEDSYFWVCRRILNERVMPELADAEDEFDKYPDAAVKILQYIDAAGARSRSNDIGRLRNHILIYAGIKTTEDLTRLIHRGNRGFNNTTLARLLVPMNKLKEFDADPQAFCDKVLENEEGYRFTAARWPAFLYDERTHEPGKMRTGLFRNIFLLWCFLLVFCGPTAADDNDDAAQSKGTPPIYQRYRLSQVTPEQIVYVACLARVLLSSQPRWKARDGVWVGKDFAASLLHVFYRNPQFERETLDWWDAQIYGTGDMVDDGEDCEMAMLLAEEALEDAEEQARRANAFAGSVEDENDDDSAGDDGVPDGAEDE